MSLHADCEAAIARVMAQHQHPSWLARLFSAKPMTRDQAIAYVRRIDADNFSFGDESFELIERYYGQKVDIQ